MRTNKRKQVLREWFSTNIEKDYYTISKLHEFIYFYEMYSKIEKDKYDFNTLDGCERELKAEIKEEYAGYNSSINEDRARLSLFITKILLDEEISELTSNFNIWNEDENLFNNLKLAYDTEYIDSVKVVRIDKKIFLICKEEYKEFDIENRNTMKSLSKLNDLENPVYITLSDKGVLLVS